jgi:tetratricopeptide (TPR) repeat protein
MKCPYRPILLLTLLITTACKPSDPEQAGPTIPAELVSLNADQLNAKAMEFHKTGNYEESARHFEYATVRDSQYYKGYFNMACAYSMLKRREPALEALSEALALNPEWVAANLTD